MRRFFKRWASGRSDMPGGGGGEENEGNFERKGEVIGKFMKQKSPKGVCGLEKTRTFGLVFLQDGLKTLYGFRNT